MTQNNGTARLERIKSTLLTVRTDDSSGHLQS